MAPQTFFKEYVMFNIRHALSSFRTPLLSVLAGQTAADVFKLVVSNRMGILSCCPTDIFGDSEMSQTCSRSTIYRSNEDGFMINAEMLMSVKMRFNQAGLRMPFLQSSSICGAPCLDRKSSYTLVQCEYFDEP